MTEQAQILRALKSVNAAPFAIEDTLNSRVGNKRNRVFLVVLALRPTRTWARYLESPNMIRFG